MTNSIAEISNCKTLFLIGANPDEAHPVIAAKMRQALRKGAALIVADPRRTAMASKADVWLPLRPGTDIALINGLMHIIIHNGWQASDFIAAHTEGFEKVAAVVADYTPEKVAAITGVQPELLYQAAKLYACSEGAAIFYTLGITEHITGTDNVMTLANLAMVTGNIGKPSSGVNPLRGQNNVQGACDMGALPDVFPGYQKVHSPEARAKFSQAWGRVMPERPGMMIPHMFDAALVGDLKTMYIMGEDPVLSDANSRHVAKALSRLDFLVVQNLFLTETAKLAHVVLPAASFAEKDGTFTNTERRIQRVRKAIEPIGNSRPDSTIIQELANRMGYPLEYCHPKEILAEMASLAPIYGGVSFDRLESKGLQWPVPDKEHPGTPFLHGGGKFSSGIGRFIPTEYLPPAELPDNQYPLLLTTGRMLYHYNVSTHPYSQRLATFRPAERAMIHPVDAAHLGIHDGDGIIVSSRRGEVRAAAWVTNAVQPGVVWMSFHFPASPVNELTNDAADKVTSTYEYKVCAVKVTKG